MAGKKISGVASGDALEDFEFVDEGRTFTCSVEALRPSGAERWWWFRVTPDVRDQRYAPFRASPDDTREDVRARITSYYDEMLARRAQPASTSHWGQRRSNAPSASGASSAPGAPTASADAGAASPADEPEAG